MSSQSSSETELFERWLRERIQERGPVTVAEFIEHALYHPQFGYYTSGPNIGPRGDFVTSPEASPAFGRLLAAHVAEVDALLDSPSTMEVIEYGPGKGTLARNLLAELSVSRPDLYNRLQYWLVEISPALEQAQRETLLPQHAGVVNWCSSLEQPPRGLQGAVIANELIDAFPVHVLEKMNGDILEQFVDIDGEGRLELKLGPVSEAKLLAFVAEEAIQLHEGERIEVNMLAEKWLDDLARVLDRGVALLIDYGDEAPGRYSPARREGTLLAYYAGGVTESILSHPGKQDITALVDFTALQNAARRTGFDVLGITRQASFLIGLGLGTTHTAESIAGTNLDAAIRYRQGLQTLVSMEGLGRFHVLLLSKDLLPERAQDGLSGLKYAGYLA
jgi:SAM-dependent MidA family methyltransferase